MCSIGEVQEVRHLSRRDAVVGYKWLSSDMWSPVYLPSRGKEWVVGKQRRFTCYCTTGRHTASSMVAGRCGFYAHKTPYCVWPTPVQMRVALWGTVLVCEYGYRASMAELLPPDFDLNAWARKGASDGVSSTHG